MKQGFIVLHRSMLEWEWYNDQNTKCLFLHLLLMANFEDKKWRGIEIKRGQVITSIENLAKSTTLTTKQTRIALSKLKKTNEIVVKGASSYSLITLTNYCLYQDIDEKKGKQRASKGANGGQTEGEQGANGGQQLNNENNDNNENNPLSPKAGDGILKVFQGGIGELEKLLDVKTNQEASANAQGWDMLHLKGIYISFLKRNGLPKNISQAFPAWCLSYTKGKKPN